MAHGLMPGLTAQELVGTKTKSPRKSGDFCLLKFKNKKRHFASLRIILQVKAC